MARVRNRGQGAGSLAASIYELLQNPIVVVSAAYRVITKSKNCRFNDAEVNRGVESGVLDCRLFDRIYSEEVLHTLQTKEYNLLTFSKKFMWVILPVTIDGFTVAYFITQGYSSPLFASDFQLMEQFGDLYSEAIRNDPSVLGDRGLMHSAIEAGFSKCRWLAFESDLIFLLNIPLGQLDEARHALGGILSDAGLVGGLSWEFSDIMSVRSNYTLAKKALNMGRETSAAGSLHIYNDYYLYDLARIIAENTGNKTCLHPQVVKLLSYDRAHDSGLLGTLELYI